MYLWIENHSGTPIYDQICRQIREQIVSGALAADDPLPSIRSLAKDLKISVITTKRAYEELEKEGFLYTVPGKGCFVAGRNTDLIREKALTEVRDALREAVRLAGPPQLKEEELVQMLHEAWNEVDDDERDRV